MRISDWSSDVCSSDLWATQFSVHKSNARLAEDIALTVKYQVPILISSIGITREVTDAIHAYGGLCFHDVINVRHAQKALEANVDGIIAIASGGGGHSGTRSEERGGGKGCVSACRSRWPT